MDHPIKHTIDFAAMITMLGTIMTFLPAIAALFTILWYILRFIEMFTGKTIAELVKRKK
jgi:hypothetical protein